MDFLWWLQDSRFAIWVAESEQFYGYSGILTLHTVGLALVVGTSTVLDLRVLGVAKEMPFAALRHISRPMWAGFSLNVTTGVILFVASAALKGTQWIFYVKLLLISAALVVDRRVRRLVLSGHTLPDSAATPTPLPERAARPLAVASLVLWAGAITAGRLMAYLE
jgi:hypothetical protein